MAKIGLTNFRYGVLTEGTDGTPTYGGALTPGKAVSCTVDITNNDASLYADDALAESDTSFAGGSVTMGIDEDDIDTMATLLGHDVTDGAMTRSTEDVAPYVGLGRIVTKMVANTPKYKVEFLYKVKFSELVKIIQQKVKALSSQQLKLKELLQHLQTENGQLQKNLMTNHQLLLI